MRDSNPRGVAPNTLSKSAGIGSPRFTTVLDLPEWVHGDRERTMPDADERD
jgi:hypothetical protein